MKLVHAIFYFKDDTVLNVWSEEGLYNNKTLDITFEKNVEATYEKSKLFAQKANYSNSKSFLTISEKVKVEDKSGSIFADKLLFDIKSKKLNIKSFNNNKANANINLNEKSFRILKFKKDKPIFQVQNISKSYNGRPILKSIFKGFSW